MKIGKNQQKILNYNAKLQEAEAKRIEAVGAYEHKKFVDNARRFKAANLTEAARDSAGVSGTSLLALAENSKNLSMDERIMMGNTSVEAQTKRSGANVSRMQGSMAKWKGRATKKAMMWQAAGQMAGAVGAADNASFARTGTGLLGA